MIRRRNLLLDNKKLYIFNYGDLCTKYTGGWTKEQYGLSGYTNVGYIYYTSGTDYIEKSRHPNAQWYSYVSVFGTVNATDITKYKTLHVYAYMTYFSSSTWTIRCGISSVRSYSSYNDEFPNSDSPHQGAYPNEYHEYIWDISDKTGKMYMFFCNHDSGVYDKGRIYSIWYEK